MSLHDKAWKYADSNATRQPGYLARKFAKVRAQLAEAQKAAPQKVHSIKRAAEK